MVTEHERRRGRRSATRIAALVRIVDNASPHQIIAETSGVVIDASFGGVKIGIPPQDEHILRALEKGDYRVSVEATRDGEKAEILGQSRWSDARATQLLLGLRCPAIDAGQERLLSWVHDLEPKRRDPLALAGWVMAGLLALAASVQTYRLSAMKPALAPVVAATPAPPAARAPAELMRPGGPGMLAAGVLTDGPPPAEEPIPLPIEPEVVPEPNGPKEVSDELYAARTNMDEGVIVRPLSVRAGREVSAWLERYRRGPAEGTVVLDVGVIDTAGQLVSGCEMREVVLVAEGNTHFECTPTGPVRGAVRLSVIQRKR